MSIPKRSFARRDDLVAVRGLADRAGADRDHVLRADVGRAQESGEDVEHVLGAARAPWLRAIRRPARRRPGAPARGSRRTGATRCCVDSNTTRRKELEPRSRTARRVIASRTLPKLSSAAALGPPGVRCGASCGLLRAGRRALSRADPGAWNEVVRAVVLVAHLRLVAAVVVVGPEDQRRGASGLERLAGQRRRRRGRCPRAARPARAARRGCRGPRRRSSSARRALAG